MTATDHDIVQPTESQRLVPSLAATANPNVWVYRYRHDAAGWVLSIATHAEPGSGKLSLGGFRIAPRERTDVPGFDPDREAIELAMGMEEKVYWSRVLRVGGPLARRDMNRIVGGKCVLHPSEDARVGHPRDRELLDWAVDCFQRFERESGVHLTTGQDMGHGLLSDGTTQSLDYLSARFPGCMDADTSLPTGEGNYYLLMGMLRACGLDVNHVLIGLIGVGNIGRHVFQRLHESGAHLIAIEANPARRQEIADAGYRVWAPEGKHEFLRQPIAALTVQAAAGSLDAAAIDDCVANPRLSVICGSENLAMPDPQGAQRLLAARKVYAPTELGGMMGYLTAVEEYLAHLEDTPFDISQLMEAAKRLEVIGFEATSRVRASNFVLSFEDAARQLAAEEA